MIHSGGIMVSVNKKAAFKMLVKRKERKWLIDFIHEEDTVEVYF